METVLTLLLPVTFLVAFALERLFPARPLPAVRGWVLKGFLFFIVTGALSAVTSAAAASYLGAFSLARTAHWPLALAVPLLVILSDAIGYVLHRTLHVVHPLWRWTHQLHHAAERLDVPGVAIFHPFDVVLQSAVALVPAALLGASPDAAALSSFVLFVTATFQHMNVRTPRWLGYLVVRPEQHSVHHARGVHAYNYGNFAFMDLLCGTFRNPEGFVAEYGFWDGASAKVGAMLIGRDVA